MPAPTPSPRRRGRVVLPLALLLLGTAVVTLAWVALATATGRQSSWMALVAAVDAAWLLRLAGLPRGWRRATWAVAATAVTVVLAHWGIIASGIGALIGLAPLASALKLGTGLAWTVAQLLNGPFDLAMLALALVVAAVAGR